jgi:L-threonylcarbamoyladenylate synthase
MKIPDNLSKEILAGKILIYPTDTIYGIGCNALDENAVNKIKEIKSRDKDKPMSVIAPSKQWIKENCFIDEGLDTDQYLPGPYTLILKKKDLNFLSYLSSETLGVRMPDNDFCKEIQKANVPFITTSVNLSGEKPANNIFEIKQEIINKVDFVIDAGELSGKPSTLIINGKEIQRN